MNFCGILVILSTCLVNINAIKLPSYFSRCSLSDPELGECIKDSGNVALPSFINGDESIHIVNLNPLFVEGLYIYVEDGLKINLTNFNIYGLNTASLRFSSWDVEEKTSTAEVAIDYTSLIGDYDISGKILILDIRGQGPCNITFEKPVFTFSFGYILETIKNKEFITITHSTLTYETTRAYFKLYNLFDGNEALGNAMLKVLDENWKEVNAEIGKRVGDALSLVFQNIVQNMFYKIPYAQLFKP